MPALLAQSGGWPVRQLCRAARAGALRGAVAAARDRYPMPANPRTEAAPPAGAPVIADFHVAATALGFEKGIAPAHGRAIAYQGQERLVVEVGETGGGPTLSGGSRFVIATKGGALEIGLKAIDARERRMAAASVR